MAWFILVIAGIVEIVMAIALKYAEGWTRVWPSVLGIFAALASVVLLTLAVKHLSA
jgi:quaternary ammonium compound-resistance protein SugE